MRRCIINHVLVILLLLIFLNDNMYPNSKPIHFKSLFFSNFKIIFNKKVIQKTFEMEWFIGKTLLSPKFHVLNFLNRRRYLSIANMENY